jgi:hypothetical protein
VAITSLCSNLTRKTDVVELLSNNVRREGGGSLEASTRRPADEAESRR